MRGTIFDMIPFGGGFVSKAFVVVCLAALDHPEGLHPSQFGVAGPQPSYNGSMSASLPFLQSSDYRTSGLRGCHSYVLPTLWGLCAHLAPGSRLLDVGCGNGSVATEMQKRGFKVTGIDLAESGIRVARQSCPAGRFEVLPADSKVLDNLRERPFDLTYSIEVIEHLYDPRSFLAGCFAATRSGGTFICGTPYHGYLKNLALSVAGAWDHHHNPLFDGGHIKFFSRRTLSAIIEEAGFTVRQFRGSGRLPYLWNSMLISAIKP